MLRDIGIFVLISLSISAIISCFMIIKERLDWCKRNKLKAIFLFLFSLFVFFGSTLGLLKILSTKAAATYYAINAGGNWSSANTWSTVAAKDVTRVGGAGVPTSADDIILDDYSGAVTIDATAAAKTLDCVGGGTYTNTLTHNSFVLTVSGSVTLAAAKYTAVGAATLAMNATGTLISAGNTLYNVTTAGAGQTFTLGDNLTLTNQFTHTSGTLVTDGGGGSLTHSWSVFDSNNANTRVITLGASTINITKTSAATSWQMSNVSNLTLNANTSIVNITGPTTMNVAYGGGGGRTFNVVNFTGAGTATLQAAGCTFGTLARTGTAVKTDSFVIYGDNNTVSGTLSLAGNSVTNRLLVQTITLGTAKTITITGATYTATNNVDFMDITFADNKVGDTDLTNGGANSIGDCGGNTRTLGTGNLVMTTAVAQTWNGTTGNWSDNTKWTSRVPLPQDDIVLAGTNTVQADMPRAGKNISFNNAAKVNLPSVNVASYGSFDFTNAGTFSSGYVWYFRGRSSYTITSAGKSFYSVTIAAPSGTYTLADAFIATSTLALASGTLSTNYNVSATTYTASASTTTTLSTGASNTWTLSGSGTVWTAAGTINAGSSTIALTYAGASASTFAGGTATYNNISIAPGSGTLTFSGAFTFANMTMSSAGTKTVKFTNGTNYTMTGTNFLSGTAGNVITISSDVGGSSFHLLKTSGTISSDYLSLQDSHAEGGAAWYAGANSTNVSGNDGWIFAAPGQTITGTVYGTDETTPVASLPLVRVKVDGGGSYFANANGSGVYTISSVPTAAGNPLTIYLDTGGGITGATFTVATGSDMSNIHLYQDRATTRCDNSCSLTNANINRWDKSDDGDIHADVDGSSNLTIDNDWKLLVAAHTLAPGGTITLSTDGVSSYSGDLEIKASSTLNMAANALSISGNYLNSGTAILSNTTSFTKISGTQTLNSGGTGVGYDFTNLTKSGGGTLQLITSNLVISGTLIISGSTTVDLNGRGLTLATLDNSGTLSRTGGETLTITTMDTDSGTVLYYGAGAGPYTIKDFGVTDYYALTINPTNGTDTFQLANDLQVNGTLTLSTGTLTTTGTNYAVNIGDASISTGSYSQTNGTFTANGSAITCFGNYSVAGGTYNANTSTLTLDTTPQNIILTSSGYTLNNVNFRNNSDLSSGSVGLGAGTLSFAGNFYLDAANTQTLTVTAIANSPAVNITGDLDFTGVGAGSESLLMGDGTWTASGNVNFSDGSITAGGSTLVMNGASKILTPSPQALNNFTSSGTISSAGDFTVSGVFNISAGTFDASDKTITLSGSGTPLVIAGAFTASTSTIKYTGSSATNVADATYNNLYLDHAGTTFTVAGDSAVSSVLTINAGTFDASNKTITLSGSGTPLVITGTFTPSTSTVKYTGSSATNVASTIYHNLIFDNVLTTFTAAGDLTVNSVLTISSGEFDGSNRTITLAGSGSPMLIAGTFTPSTSTIRYTGTSATTITNTNYHNLTLDHSGTVFSAGGSFTVGGVFNVNAGNFSALNRTITLSGSGTPFVVNGTFTAGTSTIKYTGTLATNVAGTTYHNLTLDQAGTAFTLGGDITVGSVLNINTGTFSGSNRTINLTGSGTPLAGAGTFTPSTSTLIYNGSGATNISPVNYFNLTLSGGGTYSLGAALVATGALNLSNGTLDTTVGNFAVTIGEPTTTNGSYSQTNGIFTANNSTLTCYGNYSITGGTYNAGTSTLILDATPQNITLVSNGYNLNNTTFRSNANIPARVATLGAGTLNFAGNFYLDAANAQNLTVTAAVNNPTVNITGNLDFIGVGAGSEALNLGNSTFEVDGGTINFSDGSVTPGASTLLLSGSALQTLTSASQTLYNLTITNPSAAGVVLADGLTVTNNFSDTTANSNLTFDDGSTYTINNLDLNGQAVGTRIDLRSSTPGTPWLLNQSGTQTISFVDAQDSDATGGNQINAVNGCFNSGNNLNWVFAVASIVVSPASATLNPGGTQAFTAAAYDGGGNLIPGTIFTWSVVNGGGSIDGSGNFTAGATTGTYANTVRATASAVNGLATVIVVLTPIPPTPPTPSPTASAAVAPSGGAQEAAASIPEKVVVGNEAVFDASQFEGYASYHWDFGDGNQADGVRVEHKYEKLDRYLVVLILIDKAGLETKKTFQVDVVPPEPKLIRVKTEKTNITVWGESYPKTEVIFRLESEPFETKTNSDADGRYKLNFDFNDTGLDYGEHKLSLVAAQKTEENLLLASDPNYYDVYFNLNDNGDLEIKVKQLEERQYRLFYQIAGLVLILIIVNIILVVIIVRRKNRAKIKNVSQDTKSK